MPVLTKRIVWRRPSSVARAGQTTLSGVESASVRLTLEALRVRLGSWEAVARALNVSSRTIRLNRNTRMKSGIAVRIANATGMRLYTILTRKRPVRGKRGACPTCGRAR